MDIFDIYTIPLGEWADTGIRWMTDHWRNFFQAIQWPVEKLMQGINEGLINTADKPDFFVPQLVVLAVVFVVAWRIAKLPVAIFSLLSLLFLGYLAVWDETMTTLAMVATAVVVCTVIGIPVGIAAARSDKTEVVVRPILDAMQTTPPFVYLVPVVMLFGIGNVAGVLATIVFALPPIIRLTNLGIRQVDREVVEAAYAFGSTPRQVLFEIQVPLAIRTIMAGLNQTLMLALSMVVIASIIGAGGLGDLVRRGINSLEIGTGVIGGVGIVLLAIILDRITQALGSRQESS